MSSLTVVHPVLSSASSSLTAKSRPEDTRPLASFHPSPWGDYFLNFVPDDEIIEAADKENEAIEKAMKEELLQLLALVPERLEELIDFIYAVERLGVSYRLKQELEQAMNVVQEMKDVPLNLYYTSVRFLLLRGHGLHVSCDVFSEFLDETERFKHSIVTDVKGMLSLYEASFLEKHGDYILEEARAFATTHLKSIAADSNQPFSRQVAHAMYQPWHKGMPRLESRIFISYYQEDSSHNKNLLKFAILDFNLLQIQHKKELKELTRWWKDLDLTAKMPFSSRDRLVEGYFWALGMSFEPTCSLPRKIFLQMLKLASIADDIYDAYGTLEELTLFTNEAQKWDRRSINKLPEYMQVYYMKLLDTFESFEHDLAPLSRSKYVTYLRENMINLFRFYHKEAQWRVQKYFPTFEEYMNKVAIGSTGYTMLLVAFYLGFTEANQQVFEWTRQNPQFIRDACSICRLVDDLVGHEFERQRNHIPSAVEIFMKQHHLTKEEARERLMNQVDYYWKDLNERMMRPHIMSRSLLTPILNITRMIDVLYKGEDNYTISNTTTKENISKILTDPVLI